MPAARDRDGSAAFAPGAAERAPWTGFGDAWFCAAALDVGPRGERWSLLLAVEPVAVGDAGWRAEHARIVAALTAPFVSQGQPAVWCPQVVPSVFAPRALR